MSHSDPLARDSRITACYEMGVDPHRLAELRSIALHRAIGQAILREPALVETARARLQTHATEPYYRDAWSALLDGPLDELVEFLGQDSERARELRQATPFAGAVSPRERWRIWRETRSGA